MEDLSTKINEIMSDPEKLKEIQNLGKMMGLTGNNQEVKTETPQEQPRQIQNSNSLQQTGGFSGIDPKMIMKFAPILSSLNKEDETTRLFDALEPFLSVERQEKLRKIRKMIVIMKLLPSIKNLGLF